MIPYGRHSTNWNDAISVALQIKRRSLTQGKRIEEFERAIATYVGVSFAVAVSNATSGLHIALEALDLPRDSRVITSPISFVASANAALYSNLKPLFCDIDPATINIDPQELIKLTKAHKDAGAIIPVHYAGLPCEMDRIYEIAKDAKLRIIEDAAHALGASYASGEKIGSCKYSDMTVFSFHPVKSITTGEGGVITTNDRSLYLKLLRLRSHGINKSNDEYVNKINSQSGGVINPWYYEMQELGYNFRLTEIQAVLGISQLARLDKFILKRRVLANNYHQAFKESKVIFSAQASLNSHSANHIFPVRIDFDKIGKTRNQVMSELRAAGIMTQVHYIPIPTHPYYASLGYGSDETPNANKFYSEALTIPLYPDLKIYEQRKVIKRLLQITSSDSIK